MNLYTVTYKKYSEVIKCAIVASSIVKAVDGAYQHMNKAHYTGARYEIISVEKESTIDRIAK